MMYACLCTSAAENRLVRVFGVHVAAFQLLKTVWFVPIVCMCGSGHFLLYLVLSFRHHSFSISGSRGSEMMQNVLCVMLLQGMELLRISSYTHFCRCVDLRGGATKTSARQSSQKEDNAKR